MIGTRKQPSALAVQRAIQFRATDFEKTSQELGEGNSGSLTIYRYVGSLSKMDSDLKGLFNRGSSEVAIKKFHQKVDLNEIDKAVFFYAEAEKKQFDVPYSFGLPLKNVDGAMIGVIYKIIQYPVCSQTTLSASSSSSNSVVGSQLHASANLETYIQAVVRDSEYKSVSNEIELRENAELEDILNLVDKNLFLSLHGKELLNLLVSLISSAHQSINEINTLGVCHRDIACRNVVIRDVKYSQPNQTNQSTNEAVGENERIIGIKVAMVDFGHAQFLPTGQAIPYKNKKKAPIRTLSTYTIKTQQYREQDDMIAKRILFIEMMVLALGSSASQVMSLKPDQTLQELGVAKLAISDEKMLETYVKHLWQAADLHKNERRLIIQILIICLKEYLMTAPDADIVLARENENKYFREGIGRLVRVLTALNKAELLAKFPKEKADQVKKSDLDDFFNEIKRYKTWDLPEKEATYLSGIISHAQLFEHVYKLKPRFEFYQRNVYVKQHVKQQSDSVTISPPTERRDIKRRETRKRLSLFGSLPTPSNSEKPEVFAPMPMFSQDDLAISAISDIAPSTSTSARPDNEYTALPSRIRSINTTVASACIDTPYKPLPLAIVEAGRSLDESTSATPTSPRERKEMRRLYRTVTFNFTQNSDNGSSSTNDALQEQGTSSPRPC